MVNLCHYIILSIINERKTCVLFLTPMYNKRIYSNFKGVELAAQARFHDLFIIWYIGTQPDFGTLYVESCLEIKKTVARERAERLIRERKKTSWMCHGIFIGIGLCDVYSRTKFNKARFKTDYIPKLAGEDVRPSSLVLKSLCTSCYVMRCVYNELF